jgi:hypothetical protein
MPAKNISVEDFLLLPESAKLDSDTINRKGIRIATILR